MTVFLTTHYMEEAADADYVVILDSGKIVAEGTPLSLKNSYTGDYITLYGLSEEQLDGFASKLLQDEKQRQHLYERALDNKVFEVVRENMKLEEQEISMADFEKLFQK